MVPIWKDYYVTLGSSSSEYEDYTIRANGTIVFSGRAYKRPGASGISIRINDIIADYIVRNIPAFSTPFQAATTIGTCSVEVRDSENTIVAQDTFYNDWSYQDDFSISDGFSFPVDGYVDNRQHFLYSDQGYSNGAAAAPVMTLIYNSPAPDFRATDFNADFLISAEESTFILNTGQFYGQPRVFSVYLAHFANLAGFRLGGKTFQVAPTCAEYVLHYVNAYGGWDSLLMRGNGKAADSIKHYERSVIYNNQSKLNRGRENYVNELTRKFVLHTGILTEMQSLRMHHLLDSPCVYLEDLVKGITRPVVLTGNTCDYKTFRNNGNKLMEYTIEAELAQDRIRR